VQNPGSLINFDILDVEHEVQVFYKYLQKKHYQAEIIPETEDFERYKVVIVPYGIYLSEEVQKKLLSYIEKGGLVVSTGPAGYYNELGQYSAFLLDSVAPEVKIQHNPSAVRTNIAGEDLTINAFWNFIEKEGKPAILDKKYGKGQMIVTTFPYLRNDAPVESILESCLKKYIREFIDIDNESIQIYIARNQKGKKNIFLINEDHVNAQKANIIFRKNLKISDLRAGVALLKPRNSMAIELKPGECRILQVD
jgi:beta-galactosidase GanA